MNEYTHTQMQRYIHRTTLTARLCHKQPSISTFEPSSDSYETLCNYYATGNHCETIVLISHNQ